MFREFELLKIDEGRSNRSNLRFYIVFLLIGSTAYIHDAFGWV